MSAERYALVPYKHGSVSMFIKDKCRCDLCVSEARRRRHLYYRKHNPVVKNKSKSNPDKEYDL